MQALEDASDGGDSRMAHDRELKDDASDNECDGAPKSLDDERQSEYVSSLTLPRAAQPSASSGVAASIAVVHQEPDLTCSTRKKSPTFTDRTKWYRERVFTFADGGEYTAKDEYAAVKRLHKEHSVGGHVVHAARVSATQEGARNRVPPGETQAVTRMKDINGGALGTTTLVYRPLSAQSALSQSGAVGPGESSATAAYYNPRQHVDVPDGLVNHVLPRFMDVRRQLFDGKERGEGHMTERGTVDPVEYLRLVLVRGAVELQEELPENWLLKRFPFNSREFLERAPVARNEIRQLRPSDDKSRPHYKASPATISELSRLNAKVFTARPTLLVTPQPRPRQTSNVLVLVRRIPRAGSMESFLTLVPAAGNGEASVKSGRYGGGPGKVTGGKAASI
ncbi:hypothetical protein Esi_0324_0027 [Ectocarpus siliculosus]|uniref:Uncharacterized protein n=1 Tax=Ectocarpus siliculosus TaxID=2880 RepID=D7FXC9_ECTSI|nr:hypothetical protein Esi_0324_0027 [Ectocarpus siliculosus]|eukprot:CBJ32266.1 hypothetical protein Esi_0324_0027 [Ectocarpus siliculosus]